MPGSRFSGIARVTVCGLALSWSFGCSREPSQPVYYGQPAYGQPAYGQTAPGATVPGATATIGAPVATIVPQIAVSPNDPVINHEINFLRGRAQQVLNALVAALPPQQQARVNGIPLVVD